MIICGLNWDYTTLARRGEIRILISQYLACPYKSILSIDLSRTKTSERVGLWKLFLAIIFVNNIDFLNYMLVFNFSNRVKVNSVSCFHIIISLGHPKVAFTSALFPPTKAYRHILVADFEILLCSTLSPDIRVPTANPSFYTKFYPGIFKALSVTFLILLQHFTSTFGTF